MKKNQQYPVAFLAMLFFMAAVPNIARAAATIEVGVIAEKEILVTVNGTTVTKKVKVTSAEPGETLFYTVTFKNLGDETAKNVVIDNPIPDTITFSSSRAWREKDKTLFSIDGGMTFKQPSLLKYEVNLPNGRSETRTAAPENYTTIRWIIKKIESGKSGTVGFSGTVK